jgi:hypothetical protein
VAVKAAKEMLKSWNPRPRAASTIERQVPMAPTT